MSKRNIRSAHQLPSGNWRVQLIEGYDSNGKRIVRSFTASTDWEAMKMAHDYEKGLIEDKEHITVKQAMMNYIDDRRNLIAPTTLNNYVFMANTRFKSIQNINIYDLTHRDIQRAINEDSKSAGYASIKTALAVLKSALSCYNVKIPSINKFKLPPKPPAKRELPSAKQICAIVKGTDVELPVLLAMSCGGMRMSEVRGLQYRDIFNDENGNHYVHICRARNYSFNQECIQERNKTEESTRTVPMPNEVYQLAMSKEHQSDTDFIVDMSYPVINQHYKKLMKENGLDITFHDLRAVFATTMRDLGVPKEVLQKLGGWSNSKVLDKVYIRTTQEQVLNGMNTLSGYLFDTK